MSRNPPPFSRHGTTWAEIREKASWDLFWHTEQGPFRYRLNDNGWLKVGLCPFHDDQHTGNFSVNMQTGSYVCHSCGARGNSASYVMAKYSYTLVDAITHIEENS